MNKRGREESRAEQKKNAKAKKQAAARLSPAGQLSFAPLYLHTFTPQRCTRSLSLLTAHAPCVVATHLEQRALWRHTQAQPQRLICRVAPCCISLRSDSAPRTVSDIRGKRAASVWSGVATRAQALIALRSSPRASPAASHSVPPPCRAVPRFHSTSLLDLPCCISHQQNVSAPIKRTST